MPLMVAMAVSLELYEDMMDEPGAKMSRQLPQLEKEERVSLLVVEPTVIASPVRAGE